jgi:hypothetical protein
MWQRTAAVAAWIARAGLALLAGWALVDLAVTISRIL